MLQHSPNHRLLLSLQVSFISLVWKSDYAFYKVSLLGQIVYQTYIPGHACVLHLVVWDVDLLHSSSNSHGPFVAHLHSSLFIPARFLVFLPVPQVFEQAEYSPQALHLPVTRRTKHIFIEDPSCRRKNIYIYTLMYSLIQRFYISGDWNE